MNPASAHRFAVTLLTLVVATSGVAGGLVGEAADGGLACGATCGGAVGDVTAVDALRNTTVGVGANAGAALGLREDALEHRLRTLAHADRLSTAADADRTAELARELRTIRQQTDDLDERQTQVLRAHSERNVTTDELLVELAAIDNAARQLEGRRAVASNRIEDLTAAGVDVRELRADLMTLQGPVRHRLLSTYSGAAAADTVDVETSLTSVRLETTIERQMVSESYSSTYLDASSDDPATIEGAAEILATRYSDQWENRTGYTIRRIDADLLYAEFEHTNGTVVAYIDRGTAQVFKEFHYVGASTESPVRVPFG